MATRATVLYDAPGPKAQRFNRILTWIVAAITVAILAWVGMKLADKGQFEANKWSFFLESTTWTTYITARPGQHQLSRLSSLLFCRW